MNDTHIVEKIVRAFDHLLTQLAIVRLKVKVSKCKLWSPSGISLGIKIPQGCILVMNWLMYFRCANGFSRLYHTFLDEVLSQDVVHINDLLLLGNAQVALCILSSCVDCRLFYLTWTILHFSFLFLLVSFNKKVI